MPLLGALMVSLFSGIAGFFATWVTKKVAMAAAVVVVFATLWVAFVTAINVIWASLTATFPANSAVIMGFWMVVPSNFVPGVSALITAHLAAVAFSYNKETLRLVSYVT